MASAKRVGERRRRRRWGTAAASRVSWVGGCLLQAVHPGLAAAQWRKRRRRRRRRTKGPLGFPRWAALVCSRRRTPGPAAAPSSTIGGAHGGRRGRSRGQAGRTRGPEAESPCRESSGRGRAREGKAEGSRAGAARWISCGGSSMANCG